MAQQNKIEATTDSSRHDNATIGEGTLIEPDVSIGFRYHKNCGPSRIGKNCILRKGTIIYGDVSIGDYFQSGHYVMIGGGCTIMAGVKIGERSFIAAGAVVTRDIPSRSLVRGVPGRVEPLPANLDRPNNRKLTIQPLDLWHPLTKDLNASTWPPDWKM